MSPLRKGSRCHAPALCLSQWRGWVYATFHLWDKENHRSSCNGGIFCVFRAGGFDEINRRWRNFNYSNCEVLDFAVGGRNKKENTEVFAVLPSWNDEKEERFLRQKVTVMTWENGWKIWILSKNIFGESLTKCAPSGHEKTIINRKSREPFFKYGSLRLNDLSMHVHVPNISGGKTLKHRLEPIMCERLHVCSTLVPWGFPHSNNVLGYIGAEVNS